MANILVVYSSTDGHTIKICARLQQQLEADAHRVTLADVADSGSLRLEDFDKIVVGASIRYGKHRPLVFDFIARHQAILDSRPNAFFTVNIVARKPAKNTPETNPYMLKFLARVAWQPKLLGVFAGRLDYPRYGFFDRLMIRFIMLLTQGPTAPDTVVEFTDWEQVAAFGRRVSEM